MTAGQKAARRPSSGKSILPFLSYYLTFIHYFGFSINPNDGLNQRYLSIRVKRISQAAHNNTPASADQWLASYKMRAQRSFAMGALRTGIKFTAISFTTFLTLNHCIVLVDYIYSGTKEFEELMFDVRLVITKFSALIFVLSWHCKQSQVRQLIKLVRSTSIYILGTSVTTTTTTTASADGAAEGVVDTSGSSPGDHLSTLRSPQFYANQFQWLAGSETKTVTPLRVVHDHHNKQTASSINHDWLSSSSLPSPLQNKHITRPQIAGGTDHQLGDEVSDCNNFIHESITQRIDRRILKWWLMCVSVTALHFSLSEAELTKSHHLWQWLDDYSLHQLNNQTTSKSTLLFLASFDNYIYTVHVYGTRLIGASIICIVCSFQCENIASLRWHTLQLIRSSKHQMEARYQHPPVFPSRWWLNYGCSANKNQNAINANVSNERSDERAAEHLCDRSWHWRHLFGSFALKDADSILSYHEKARCRLHVAKQQQQHQQQQKQKHCSSKGVALKPSFKVAASWPESCQADRDLFFVLGESDWITVRENVARLSPHGYLSSSMWLAKSRLLEGTTRLMSLILKICLRLVRVTIARFAIQITGKELAAGSKADRHALDTNTHLANSASLARDWRLPKRRAHNSASFSSLFPLRVAALSDNSYTENSNNNNNNNNIQWGTPLTTTTRVLSNSGGATITNDATRSCQFTTDSSCLFGPTPKQFATNAASLHSEKHINNATYYNSFNYHCPHQAHMRPNNAAASEAIEWQMERLASKYELVRTVNGRIDSCFGPMLLIQFSFLFLMSCIDVVYFSICFNPNTKTKYIIISGMILLWWPYLLLYKFASDIGSNSKELLISVRRLARLSLILSHSKQPSINQQPLLNANHLRPSLSAMGHLSPLNRTSTFGSSRTNHHGLFEQHRTRPTMFGTRSYLINTAGRTRARIINKLDHVFKPTTLSILDILTVDKFFLLNFAKIVITASVMIIQFISK